MPVMPHPKLKGFTVELICHIEDSPIHGHFYNCDNQPDKEIEDWINNQLSRGNQWAWCYTEVKVTSPNGFSESEYLHCCSYANELDFKNDGYFEDMINEATLQLKERLKRIIENRHLKEKADLALMKNI